MPSFVFFTCLKRNKGRNMQLELWSSLGWVFLRAHHGWGAERVPDGPTVGGAALGFEYSL